MDLTTIKLYCRIDYNDDDSLVELIRDAVFEEMSELIPEFDSGSMTNRQKMLALVYIKDLYDNREKTESGKGKTEMRAAVRSMLLKEMLRGGGGNE